MFELKQLFGSCPNCQSKILFETFMDSLNYPEIFDIQRKISELQNENEILLKRVSGSYESRIEELRVRLGVLDETFEQRLASALRENSKSYESKIRSLEEKLAISKATRPLEVEKEVRKKLPKALKQSRSIRDGHAMQQFAHLQPTFPYDRHEFYSFTGNAPVDGAAFIGRSLENIREIVLLDKKHKFGGATRIQRQVEKLVNVEQRVRFEVF